MRTYKTAGIIIKRKNISEADRILTVFTKEHGKIQIKAKGVRKITSRRSSHVELLNYGIFNVYKGQGMPVLTEIQPIQSYRNIKSDLRKTGYSYHVCELIDGLCPEQQEMENIFHLLVETLNQLAELPDTVAIIHSFEIALLSKLGYWTSTKTITEKQTEYIIEHILERKLKTRQILPHMQ